MAAARHRILTLPTIAGHSHPPHPSSVHLRLAVCLPFIQSEESHENLPNEAEQQEKCRDAPPPVKAARRLRLQRVNSPGGAAAELYIFLYFCIDIL